jgi:hypothetical protein
MKRKSHSTKNLSAVRDEHFRRLDAEQRAAIILNRKFGIDSQECAPPIDLVIMGRLREALSIDVDLLSACWQRGLMSSALLEAVNMTSFLASTLPMARAAQAQTGVPASVLIAEAYEISRTYFDGVSFDWSNGRVNDLFNTGAPLPSIKDAFMARAYELKKDAKFKLVLRVTSDPAQYLEQLKLWSARKYGVELVALITTHSLVECDALRPAH